MSKKKLDIRAYLRENPGALTAEEYLDIFLTFLRNEQSEYRIAQDIVTDCENKQCDIEHSLELNQHTYNEQARLARGLIQVRRERREAKVRVEVAEPIKNWAENNHAVVKEIETLLGKVRQVGRKQSNRVYVPRTDIVKEVL